MIYEIWGRETGNIIDSFRSLEEAIEEAESWIAVGVDVVVAHSDGEDRVRDFPPEDEE